MDEQYLPAHASRSVLLDLSEADLEMSGLDQDALDTSMIDEGGLAIGFDEAAAQSWFDFVKKVAYSPASPSAEQHVENASQEIDQSLFATDAIGMTVTWSSLSVHYDSMMNDSTRLLKMPSATGSAAEAALWHKTSMYRAIASSTANQDAAVELVDFLLGDPDAGTIIGFNRGVTSNTDVRDVVLESISETDTKPAEYLDRCADELGEAPDPTPPAAPCTRARSAAPHRT